MLINSSYILLTFLLAWLIRQEQRWEAVIVGNVQVSYITHGILEVETIFFLGRKKLEGHALKEVSQVIIKLNNTISTLRRSLYIGD